MYFKIWVGVVKYSDDNRGVIQHRQRAKQILDFSELKFDKITPTDIDGFIEWHDKAAVFFEVKYGDAEMPKGQKLALQRTADNFQAAGKNTIILVCRHDIEDCSQDVNVGKTIVKGLYLFGKWYKPLKKATAKDITTWFLSEYG